MYPIMNKKIDSKKAVHMHAKFHTLFYSDCNTNICVMCEPLETNLSLSKKSKDFLELKTSVCIKIAHPKHIHEPIAYGQEFTKVYQNRQHVYKSTLNGTPARLIHPPSKFKT